MSSSAVSLPRDDASTRPMLIYTGIGIVLCLILWYFFGDGFNSKLSTAYGQRRGARAADSVNGTAVAADLFEQSGRRVSVITRLDRSIEKYDTIVWFPNDFVPPTDVQIDFLDKWLTHYGKKRTLIYVGRDYDAAEKYWARMAATDDPERKERYELERAHAQSEFDAARAKFTNRTGCRWFKGETLLPPRRLPDLEGPWADGVDAGKTEIVLRHRVQPPTDNTPLLKSEVLLQSENDVVAFRVRDDVGNPDAKVIVIANGSFLLNLPLVNKEHRKLVAHLIAETSPGGKTAFLESGLHGPQVVDREPQPHEASAWKIFMVWPLSFIVIHFAAYGIAYCISQYPVFGRPHRLPTDARADFGLHVAALGDLMLKSRDAEYAKAKIEQYHSQAKRGSGKSHLPKALGK